MKRRPFIHTKFGSMMKLIFMVLMLSLAMSFFGAGTSTSYELPRVIYWAAGDVGSKAYALSALTAEKIAPVLGVKMRLIPGNDVERITMLRVGRAHMSYTSADAYWSTMGLSSYSTFALGPQPLRIIWGGWPSMAGSTGLATRTSGIKTPYDLKGKRIVNIVGAAWSIEGARGALAFGKIKPEDVTIVQVSSTGASYKALAEGKADFAYGACNAPGAYECDASPYGIYLVRYAHEDKEGWKRYRKFMPYHVPGITIGAAGMKKGEKAETPFYANPMFCTMESTPDEFAYAVAKAIYEKNKEIVASYPGADALEPERATKPEVMVMAPYHPGSIKFFKEVGLWKKEQEDANNARLAHLKKVNDRWSTYVEETQERMERTKKGASKLVKKEWRKIVEDEVGLVP